MSHNPQPVSGGPFALPGHRVLALSGPGATAFAQAQFMNDIAALQDGCWQWNGWLTPKGRVIALFALLRIDAQSLWLLLSGTAPTPLVAELQRFVFRSKVALAPREDLHASGWFGGSNAASGASIGPVGDAIELDLGTQRHPRTLRIASAGAAEDARRVLDWARFDLEHGLPHLPPDQAAQWTPQQLSLDRLRAYSVKKGCYPGQEIVARTHFLGQAKRGLVLLEGDAAMSAGDEVIADGRVLGSLACVADRLALAVLPIDRDAAMPLTVAGSSVVERALLDGLAR